MNTPFDPIISEIRQHVYQVSVNYWLRRKSVYSSFIDSPNFRHIGIVSYSHSKGTTPFQIKLLHGKKNKKSVRPCGTEYRAGSRTVQKQEAVPPIIIESALCMQSALLCILTAAGRSARSGWQGCCARCVRAASPTSKACAGRQWYHRRTACGWPWQVRRRRWYTAEHPS